MLETRFRTASGGVLVIDFMALPLGRDVSLAPDRRRVDPFRNEVVSVTWTAGRARSALKIMP